MRGTLYWMVGELGGQTRNIHWESMGNFLFTALDTGHTTRAWAPPQKLQIWR